MATVVRIYNQKERTKVVDFVGWGGGRLVLTFLVSMRWMALPSTVRTGVSKVEGMMDGSKVELALKGDNITVLKGNRG